MIRALGLAALLASPVGAQTYAPDMSPSPIQDPNRPAVPDVTQPQSIETTAPGLRDQLFETDADYATCLISLDNMGVTFSEADPIIPEEDADCGILRPLTITEIAPGIAIQPAATLRCEIVLALAIWTSEFVVPASERLPERGALSVIENGSGYICRRRNNLSDGKLSEHAFGNAFDVMAFGFEDGSRVTIEPREAEGSMDEAFQDAVRATACLEFSTVLGPGSNATHDDHLHLDIIARGSGYRLCEQGGGDPE